MTVHKTIITATRYDLPRMIDEAGLLIGAEIGVHHGHFSYYLLRHSGLRLLWSVDSYQGKFAPFRYDAEIYLSEFGERGRLIHSSSAEAADLADQAGQKFNFVYIDADHRYHAVASDIRRWWDLLTPGGMLAGHDYVSALARCGVIPAVDEFAAERGLDLILTREHWATWILWKP